MFDANKITSKFLLWVGMGFGSHPESRIPQSQHFTFKKGTVDF